MLRASLMYHYMEVCQQPQPKLRFVSFCTLQTQSYPVIGRLRDWTGNILMDLFARRGTVCVHLTVPGCHEGSAVRAEHYEYCCT
jgi:hypothetical protein